ncbi:hypothetical protein [Streptomyces natalensis]|uniref:Lipoprotein n=1 Tax=Streptomyces natalensis ATCC 27448 TaxID=1240678 RepID=A0A0D7CHU6_9ACTN|nr:hypothetical protein [Streptomyces natalensis]KIZ15430.1 lipoprotein [Streptomyces natalensis ATCC 27448]
MNRRPLSIAAALTGIAALLLTACGSGSDESTPDKIKGAGGDSNSPSASASVPKNNVDRPKITLPKSFQADFVGWSNNDPKLQAILDDGRERLRGDYAAIIERVPQAHYMAFYNTATALTTGEQWVKGFISKNETITGKVSVSNPQARVSPDGSGTLFYCVDEGKSSTKNLKTAKVIHTPADSAHVLYQTKLIKTKQGVWQTKSITTTPGGCK